MIAGTQESRPSATLSGSSLGIASRRSLALMILARKKGRLISPFAAHVSRSFLLEGRPGRDSNPDLGFARNLLYPVELPGHLIANTSAGV